VRQRSRLQRWLARALGRESDSSYVRYLQEVAADSAVQRLRDQSLARLRLGPGQYVVDLGCGPGTLTLQLAALVGVSGRVVGVDRDRHMVQAADRLAAQAQLSDRVTHRVDDCTALACGDRVFDACYCERVFQHLGGAGPSRAAAEAIRVLKPGGRVVLVDSDWSTLVINVDHPDLARRIVDARAKAFPNPQAGRHLRGYLTTAGAVDVEAIESALDIGANGATAELLTRTAEAILSPTELAIWNASLARARHNHLPWAHLTMTVVAGTKSPAGVGAVASR
jgi:ubiquinone/menaquinone biosynthesis C-methylase UbiE